MQQRKLGRHPCLLPSLRRDGGEGCLGSGEAEQCIPQPLLRGSRRSKHLTKVWGVSREGCGQRGVGSGGAIDAHFEVCRSIRKGDELSLVLCKRLPSKHVGWQDACSVDGSHRRLHRLLELIALPLDGLLRAVQRRLPVVGGYLLVERRLQLAGDSVERRPAVCRDCGWEGARLLLQCSRNLLRLRGKKGGTLSQLLGSRSQQRAARAAE
eukprot:5777205-Prymnesium_polylepis.3